MFEGAIIHYEVSIISYTSLDDFSYSSSSPDIGLYTLHNATSAFSEAIK
jgi:hypothetical protein